MSVFLSETDIARFLGQSVPDTRKAIKSSTLKEISRQGQKVFQREEVLNWFADNFTSLTSERLMRADFSSADNAGLDPFSCGITNLLAESEIRFPDRTSTRSSILRYISTKAVELGAVYDSVDLREQLEQREEIVSTALKCGAALIHPLAIKQMYVEKELLLLIIPPHPIPFGEPGGRLTSLFFLLLFPDSNRHVHILARLNRLLRCNEFIEAILEAESHEEVLDLVYRRELLVISSRGKI
ncbi:MAG: PTS sugar transporter subunit IIA [Candidatus Fermentibacteraceae bacterium]|nr:PTS sugar transporter subunit IIA [Candidatus Fermentibacteraceae bacterium]